MRAMENSESQDSPERFLYLTMIMITVNLNDPTQALSEHKAVHIVRALGLNTLHVI